MLNASGKFSFSDLHDAHLIVWGKVQVSPKAAFDARTAVLNTAAGENRQSTII